VPGRERAATTATATVVATNDRDAANGRSPRDAAEIGWIVPIARAGALSVIVFALLALPPIAGDALLLAAATVGLAAARRTRRRITLHERLFGR
jgi:hypothetical protein